jgi:imidazolonepropionase-like amidohydrolase
VGTIREKETLLKDPKVQVFQGRGRTFMPGLGDAHTHYSWSGGDVNQLGDLPIEEHVLGCAMSAQCYLDSGFTMCFGAAAAKDRLDVVIRNAINAGDIPGPRTLANAREIATTDGDLNASITAHADGPEQMAEMVNRHIDLGIDQVKLSMSGEEVRISASLFKFGATCRIY